jgi:hypothetical protein
MKGIAFDQKRYAMCHLCGTICINSSDEGQKCYAKARDVEILDTPLGYEQITVMANYDCLFAGNGWDRQEMSGNSRTF